MTWYKRNSTDTLYKYVSIVFQDVVLFNTSIMENIRIGRSSATDEEVMAAAKMACCDFIDDLENGYNTIVGENGATLSGGERQRLSIARAFFKRFSNCYFRWNICGFRCGKWEKDSR